jgi:hypothetical protein
MKKYLLLFLVPSLAIAQENLNYTLAVDAARSVPPKCIMREDGALFRAIKRDDLPVTALKWEQCSVDTGWVQGPVVEKRMNSDQSKAAKWSVTSCRCQHD